MSDSPTLPLPFPLPLADLVQDIDKSFWNGRGRFEVTDHTFAEQLQADPRVSDLGSALGGASFLSTALQVGVQGGDTLRLGERHGSDQGFSLDLTGHAGAGLALYVVLGQAGLTAAARAVSGDASTPNPLSRLAERVDLGSGPAVILSFTGGAGAGLSSDVLNQGAASASFRFQAGGGIGLLYCRPVEGGARLRQALGIAFTRARLPQTPLSRVLDVGQPLDLEPGEVLLSRYIGSLAVGLDVSYGFDFQGGTDYSLGKLDLRTRLEVAGKASLSLDFGLAGGFEVAVQAGSDPGWVRVDVDRDRSRTFSAAFTLEATASLDTPGVKNAQGLSLLESILGITTPQVLQEALAFARMTPEQLEARADGFLRDVVSKWVGEAFEEIDDTRLEDFLGSVSRIADEIEQIDDKAVSLYEEYLDTFLDKTGFQGVLDRVNRVLDAAQQAPEEARKDLLRLVGDDPRVRAFVETLLERSLGSLFTRVEDRVTEARQLVQKLEQLLTSEAEADIRRFINAKKDALGLTGLVEQIRRFDSLQKLQQEATAGARELAGRLLGQRIDGLVSSAPVREAIGELNDFARKFDQVVADFNGFVEKALNARARLEIAASYQRTRTKEKLLSVEVHVGTSQASDKSGLELYGQAAAGNFREVLRARNLDRVRVHQAQITDRLATERSLSVNIAGWDYQRVLKLTSELQQRIEVGAQGTLTVWNLKVEGDGSVTEKDRRSTRLQYLLGLAGTVAGVIDASDELRREAQVTMKELSRLETEFSYGIRDKLASPDELRLYFQLAVVLRVIDENQVDDLMQTVRELQENGVGDSAFSGVEIRYTSSFSGPAFLEALKHDFTGEVEWWIRTPRRSRNRLRTMARSYREALAGLLIDRLQASYRPPIRRTGDALENLALPALYQNGVYLDFEQDSNVRAHLDRWTRQMGRGYPYHFADLTTSVPVARPQVAWAFTLFLAMNQLAKFLDGFRENLDRGQPLDLGDADRELRKLVKRLDGVGRDALQALPLLLLDEMVRRTSPGDPQARTALFEIRLLDPNGKEVGFLPLSYQGGPRGTGESGDDRAGGEDSDREAGGGSRGGSGDGS